VDRPPITLQTALARHAGVRPAAASGRCREVPGQADGTVAGRC